MTNSMIELALSIVVSIVGAYGLIAFCFGKKIQQLDQLTSDMKDVKTDLAELSKAVAKVETAVCLSVPGFQSTYSQHNSLIGLSEKGREVSKELEAENMITAHLDELTAKLNSEKLGNAYDIQQETFNVIMTDFYGMLTADETVRLKEVAFQKGEPIEAYLIVFQIMFRDIILKSKGIEIAEVDKYAPNDKESKAAKTV